MEDFVWGIAMGFMFMGIAVFVAVVVTEGAERVLQAVEWIKARRTG